MPWNDGLQMDNISPLLAAIPMETGDAAGWFYSAIEYNEKQLQREDNNSWKPSSLGKAEISAINIMVMQGGYLSLDEEMKDYLEISKNSTLATVVQNLINSREFMKDGDFLRPINHTTHILTIEDGSGFVSSELERFDFWCNEKNIKPNYLNFVFIE